MNGTFEWFKGLWTKPAFALCLAAVLFGSCVTPIGGVSHSTAHAAGAPFGSSGTLPRVIHECDVDCMTLTLDPRSGNYMASVMYSYQQRGPAMWTVERFDRTRVRLHRQIPVDQVFEGQVSPDGNRLTNITVNGAPDSKVRIAWGTALNTVPGSHSELQAELWRAHEATKRPTCHVEPTAPSGTAAPIDHSAIQSNLPEFIHACDANCTVLKLQGGDLLDMRYWTNIDAKTGFSPYHWKILSFKAGCVKIQRNSPGEGGILEGRISPDDNMLVDTTVDGYPHSVQVAWGSALKSVPGSNGERDAPIVEARRNAAIARRSAADNQAIQLIWNARMKNQCPPSDIDPNTHAARWLLNPQQASELTGEEAAANLYIVEQCFLLPQNDAEEAAWEKSEEKMRKFEEQFKRERKEQCLANPHTSC